MFSTISYNNGLLEEEEVSTKEPSSDRPQKRLACLECRVRKPEEPGQYGGIIPSGDTCLNSILKASKALHARDSPPLKGGGIGCNCAQSATLMLGELDSKISNIAELSVDAILTDQKFALGQFNSWLTCENCHSPRATTKIIVLIAEGLCYCLERAVTDYVGQLQEGGEEPAQFLTGFCNIGNYPINSWHEWTHILRVALLCRCKELHAAVASLQERDVLNTLLSEAEQKLTNMMNRLKKCEGDL
ncbi:hypothetical protein TSTA_085040 [Talaromyces stipitatus ATCC 10500]|uniref:Uncharacterized protein n=1 Tax=Talaromyces stipitatus (strain ATCC 10500 / CBS 375.48 / QM 6759 / NRRL 1006) TaxID=441959 RepID=B8M0H6_TALSN|nr:uncharacterized protein TSTA_085040 [Talaromyces stipitatus ATCC 10500]EED21273.1 hypothetical protein TSTA_085040 [Talaromyces stipitatus ATCC 10500]